MKLISFLLILFFISISFVSAENNNTQTNEILTDNNNLTTNSFNALQEEISSSKSTLELNKDYAYDEGFDKTGIVINKPITLNGNGITLNGKNTARIFNINADNVTINNIRFVNGFDNSTGGAILCKGSNLIINNCTFINNEVNFEGGAIGIYNINSKILNSYFDSNIAKECAGAIRIKGNGTYFKGNLFTNNLAKEIHGGACYINSNNTIIENNNFTFNYANKSGGGFRLEGDNQLVANNYFQNNTAHGYLGGGCGILGSYVTVTDNIYRYNFAGRDGGGLNLEGSLVEDNGYYNIIKNNLFIGNIVLKYGAGIGTDGQYLTVFNNTLMHNQAGELGGAIRISGAPSNTGNVTYNTMINNYANVSGGGLYIMGNGTFISHNVIINTTAVNVAGGAINIHGNDSAISYNHIENTSCGMSGGAIYWEGNSTKLMNNNITNCKSQKSGGAIRMMGDSITISNNRITDNSAGTIGGAMQIKGDNAVINNNEIISNAAKSSGGAIYIEGDYDTISSNSFMQNRAGKTSSGGAIRLIGDYADVNKNKFEKNSAKTGLSIFASGNFKTLTSNVYVGSSESKEVIWNIVKINTKFVIPTTSFKVTSKTKTLTITLKDAKDRIVKNKKISIKINGKSYTKTTNSKGIVTLKLTFNTVKTYTATLKFAGSSPYNAVTQNVKIKIVKEKTKITAPSKTFKKSAAKKVTVILKSSSNSILKNKKVTLKVNGKTYKATTNKKGQATFKLTLTKKKTFTYTVKFAGDKTYYAVSKNGKITIK